MELCLHPQLIKKWKTMVKKEAKEARRTGMSSDPRDKLEVKFHFQLALGMA
jgi:intron-binding protein aquarius